MIPKHNNLRWLQQELETWVKNGIITSEQATQIRGQYNFEQAPPWYLRTSFILKAVASLFIIMGLFLLISHNWHQFPIVVRMLLTLTPMLVAASFAIKYLFDNNREGVELALFFTCLTLGLNIFMQAQIFHISSYYPNGLLWWLLGSLPVLLYFRTSLLNICLQVLFLIWIAQQIDYEQFTFLGFAIMASFLYVVYRKKDALSIIPTIITGYFFLFNLIQVTEGWENRYDAWQLAVYTCNYALVALALLSRSKSLVKTTIYKRLEILGTWLIFFFAFWWTFEEFVRYELIKEPFMVVNYVLFLVALGIYFINQHYRSVDIALAFTCLALFVLWSVISPTSQAFIGESKIIISIVFVMNIVTLLFGLFKIFYGLHQQIKYHFMSGIFILMVLAIARYLDFFDNYVVMSLIFMGSGVLIYFLNNFWNKRYGKA